eukprot:GHUV01004165.1.p1 GENE.GHUV01004165.1~~GHUV01004165.1.p1  ORF type:complete len:364 (+),score=79.37 GHUV01004165.1:278-1369(+)
MRQSISVDSAMDCPINVGLRGKQFHQQLELAEQHHASQAHGHDEHPQRHCLVPQEIYDHIADGGAAKHKNSLLKEVVCGVMAGCFIGFGFSTCMIAAGQIPLDQRKANPGVFNLLFGAYGFPVGLSLCVINGASLFTSNIAYMMAAFIEKKATVWQAMWVVWLSYFTNLCGCLLMVGLMLSGDVFMHREGFTIELAYKKCSYSFGATLTKGILCNWLVCMAVWQGNAAQDIASKLLGIWFPISAFVTMGFEHSIANMFVVPLGMMLGADITTNEFIVKNLIPATIGNLIGGGFFVATWMGMSYGSWEKAITSTVSGLWSRSVHKALPQCNGDGSGCHRNVHSPEMATVAELPVTASVRPHPQV